MELPPGLDPVTAGRFGLWLLGQRSHRKALKRTFFVKRVRPASLQERFVRLIAPWRIEEYPGCDRVLPALCGVAHSTARAWLWSDKRLPRRHALTLAAICDARAAEFAALAVELRAHAASVPERRVPQRHKPEAV